LRKRATHREFFFAEVVELVDTHVSGACVERHAGSSPAFGTKNSSSHCFLSYYWFFKCYHSGNIFAIFDVDLMRVIAVKTIKYYWKKYPEAKQALLSWYDEAQAAEWYNRNILKSQYKNASVLNRKRVVFNIHGNGFRLIVDIEYRLKIVFIVWFGTHSQYDLIDSKTVSYDKTDKK
jgi:mRNA interferase HigB